MSDWRFSAQILPLNENVPNQELLVLRYNEGCNPGNIETVFALFHNGRLTDIKTRVKPTLIDWFAKIEVVESRSGDFLVNIGNTGDSYSVNEFGTFAETAR